MGCAARELDRYLRLRNLKYPLLRRDFKCLLECCVGVANRTAFVVVTKCFDRYLATIGWAGLSEESGFADLAEFQLSCAAIGSSTALAQMQTEHSQFGVICFLVMRAGPFDFSVELVMTLASSVGRLRLARLFRIP